MTEGRDWIQGLPGQLAAQRRLLLGPLSQAEADPRWRFVELSCSLARGNGDELSDVDAALGAGEGDWAETLDAASALVQRCGPMIAMLRHGLGWRGRTSGCSCIRRASSSDLAG